MNKQEFLAELQNALTGLSKTDIDERLSFYSEMIDDRIEEGEREEDIIANIGSVDDIANQTIADIPLTKIVKERIKSKRTLEVWEIILIILGSPVWIPLLIASVVVILAIYIVIWAFIICLWAVDISLVAMAVGGLVSATIYFAQGYGLQALAMLGIALLSAGLSIFMFFVSLYASKGVIYLTKKLVLSIKSRLVRKENVK